MYYVVIYFEYFSLTVHSSYAICAICSKGKERKRKQQSSLPDGSGWGDHIQLLQIYENWDLVDYDPDWCTDNDLQVLLWKIVSQISLSCKV